MKTIFEWNENVLIIRRRICDNDFRFIRAEMRRYSTNAGSQNGNATVTEKLYFP